MRNRIHAVCSACGRAMGIGLLALFLWTPANSARADVPNLFHFYEDSDESERAVFDSGSGLLIHLAEDASQTSEKARFGTGSLLIRHGIAWEKMIQGAEWDLFLEEVRQMTITAWVRPSGLEPFVVFWRLPSGLEWPGFFQFACLGGETNPLYFVVTGLGEGEDGKGVQHQISSTQNISLQPNEWNHLALTFNEGEVTFYFNGERVGKPVTVPVVVIPAITHPLPSIKAVAGVVGGMYVDDFGFFGNRALNEDEIFLIYQDGLKEFVNKHQNQN